MCFSNFVNIFIYILFLQFHVSTGAPTAVLNNCQSIYRNHLPLSQDLARVERLPNWQDPEIAADRAAIYDLSTNTFLWEKNSEVRQPMASITKLMTALVFLDHNPGWDRVYRIGSSDQVEGGKVYLFNGEEIKVKDLFYSSLVASDNGATIALVHATGLSEDEFISKMNSKAKQLGLFSTSFVDPIGLSDNNLSTARDIARLARAALKNEEIKKATLTSDYSFETLQGKGKKIESTDYLLGNDLDNAILVQGGKTGYTDKAGYCFVGQFKDKSGREVISVVLNSLSKNDRFKQTKALVVWTFAGYRWWE